MRIGSGPDGLTQCPRCKRFFSAIWAHVENCRFRSPYEGMTREEMDEYDARRRSADSGFQKLLRNINQHAPR